LSVFFANSQLSYNTKWVWPIGKYYIIRDKKRVAFSSISLLLFLILALNTSFLLETKKSGFVVSVLGILVLLYFAVQFSIETHSQSWNRKNLKVGQGKTHWNSFLINYGREIIGLQKLWSDFCNIKRCFILHLGFSFGINGSSSQLNYKAPSSKNWLNSIVECKAQNSVGIQSDGCIFKVVRKGEILFKEVQNKIIWKNTWWA